MLYILARVMGDRQAGWAPALTLAIVGSAAAAGAGTPIAGTGPGGAGGAAQAAGAGSERFGARLERKLADILRHARKSASEVRLTPLPESEVNAWLAHQGAPRLPPGIRDPVVRIGDGRLTAEAVIDLDAIRGSRDRTAFDPVRYLGGRLAVTAGGRVRSGGGTARVELESVTIAGVPAPVGVLQELVRFFTRTAGHPAGTSLDDPIALPYGIDELRLSPGLAVVVQ